MPFTPREVLKRLRKAGFEVVRHRGGSHRVIRNADGRQVVVPFHTKTLPKGTFRSILRQAGLSEEEFQKL